MADREPGWSTGTVREWHDEVGWGVIIDSGATPGGCWCHYSAILADGYRGLEVGETVHLRVVAREQDGSSYLAESARRPGEQQPAAEGQPSTDLDTAAFASELTIRFDDESRLEP